MKKRIALTITFVMALVMLISYFVPHGKVVPWTTLFSKWAIVISGFAIALGIFSLIRLHWNKLRKKGGENKFYSIVALLSILTMSVLGFVFGIKSGPSEMSFLGFSFAVETNPFTYLFDTVFVPLDATMFSLLAFYIASAAFRAFRMKSFESGLLLVAAVIVMLGRVPVGEFISDLIPQVSDFILEFPNNAAKRAIMIGVALGICSTSLKIMLGIERSYMGGN